MSTNIPEQDYNNIYPAASAPAIPAYEAGAPVPAYEAATPIGSAPVGPTFAEGTTTFPDGHTEKSSGLKGGVESKVGKMKKNANKQIHGNTLQAGSKETKAMRFDNKAAEWERKGNAAKAQRNRDKAVRARAQADAKLSAPLKVRNPGVLTTKQASKIQRYEERAFRYEREGNLNKTYRNREKANRIRTKAGVPLMTYPVSLDAVPVPAPAAVASQTDYYSAAAAASNYNTQPVGTTYPAAYPAAAAAMGTGVGMGMGEAAGMQQAQQGGFLTNYMNTNFPQLCSLYANRYRPFHNGLTVADFPNRQRSFIKAYLFDWLFVLIGLILLATWFAEPPTFYFRLDDPDISYPLLDPSIGSAAITLSIILGPIAVALFAQIWVRDLRDFHHSALTVLELFVTNQIICMFMWLMIGGLRPQFLAICNPDPNAEPSYVTPGGFAWYSDKVCRAQHHDLVKSKHSFPSDHAAGAVSAALFIVIYVSAKLKTFDNKSHFWKIWLTLPFIVLALWFSFSRIRDGQHRFRDVIIGMIIGAIVAPIIYRLNFCSLVGPDNHIPSRYTWFGKHITWRGRNRLDADRTLPVTNNDKLAEQQMREMNPNMMPAGSAAV